MPEDEQSKPAEQPKTPPPAEPLRPAVDLSNEITRGSESASK